MTNRAWAGACAFAVAGCEVALGLSGQRPLDEDAGNAEAGDDSASVTSEAGTDADGGASTSDAASSGDVDPDSPSNGDAALPPSCAPTGDGMTNCGATKESCCKSLDVVGNNAADAGAFYRTYGNSGGGATGEADPATVSTFALDKYLVTVGRFRQFVKAWDGGAGWMPPQSSGIHTHLNGGRGLINPALITVGRGRMGPARPARRPRRVGHGHI
jgi:hypothetical protein